MSESNDLSGNDISATAILALAASPPDVPLTQPSETAEPANGDAVAQIAGISVTYYPPQATAQEVPDALPLPLHAPESTDALSDSPATDVTAAGAAGIAPAGLTIQELREKARTEAVSATSAVEVVANDMNAELARLEQRVAAQPTSEQAKQELLSFKALNGVAS